MLIEESKNLKTPNWVMDTRLTAVSEEESFPEDKSRESPSQEPSSDNPRFLS